MVEEETHLAGGGRSRWYSAYLGQSYREAVAFTLANLARNPARVLKTDLWNERLGGARDVLGHLQSDRDHYLVGIDLSLAVCAGARARVPRVRVVQADIAALPFRSGSFDAVLDLSTLDHLRDAEMTAAVAGYERVLRELGVLLLVFWQRNPLLGLKLLVKRVLGRREKAGQRYFARASVRATAGQRLLIVKEFVTGTLLLPPPALIGAFLGRLPDAVLARLLRSLVRIERWRVARPLLEHVAGLYGITAVKRGA